MKRFLYFLVLLAMFCQPLAPASARVDSPSQPTILVDSMPGYPTPARPIPHHEPGHASKAGGATAYTTQTNAQGVAETVEVQGLTALMANGTINDPFGGNYTFVDYNNILVAQTNNNGNLRYETQQYITGTNSLTSLNSWYDPASSRESEEKDIAAADLNGDQIDEQVVAWVNTLDSNHIQLAVGELPGDNRTWKVTSQPAIVGRKPGNDALVDVVVRGYDEALWHNELNTQTGNWTGWKNDAGGLLVSAPAIVSRGNDQFDVFMVGADNQVYARHWWNTWSAGWGLIKSDPATWGKLDPVVPRIEVEPPAVVSLDGNGFELFRLAPDHTLRWVHSDGVTWGDWINLHGYLASGPTAVVVGPSKMMVMARGVDDALWYRVYTNGAWSEWQHKTLAAGGGLAAAPGAAARNTGTADYPLTVYARGNNGQLYSIQYQAGVWQDWQSFAGPENPPVSPIAATIPPGATNTYLSVQLSDGSLASGKRIGSASPTWTPYQKLPSCCLATPLDTGLIDNVNNVKIPELQLAAGYFSGDGRQQIVLAYPSGSTGNDISLELFGVKDGFRPYKINSTTYFISNAWHPRLAVGDYDGDGYDEIGLAFWNPNDKKIWVQVLRVDPTDPNNWKIDWKTNPWASESQPLFHHSLSLAGGDLDGNREPDSDPNTPGVRDELVLQYDKLDGNWYTVFTQALKLKENVLVSGIPNILGKEFEKPSPDPGDVRVHMTVGDLDGNGRDEIIRYVGYFVGSAKGVWPYLHPWIEIYQADAQLALSGITGNDLQYNTRESYWSNLAAGDINRDGRSEIVLFDRRVQGDGVSQEAYRVMAWDDSISDSFALKELVAPQWVNTSSWINTDFALGNFTGESLRAGPPTYRVQSKAGGITAILHAPPKHIDTFNGQTVDVNSTNHEYTSRLTTTTSVGTRATVTAERKFSVAKDASATWGNDEATHVTGSLGETYGYNFENTETALNEFTISNTVGAEDEDIVYFVRTDYAVWEYPLYAGDTIKPASHLAVIWPISAPTGTYDMVTNDTCNHWYQPNHQLLNMWSYPGKLEDIQDFGRQVTQSGTNPFNATDISGEFNSEFTFSKTTVASLSSSLNWGMSRGLDTKIGGEEITTNLEVISFAAKLPSVSFAMQANYDESYLSTLEFQATETTQVVVHNPPGTDPIYNYKIKPYLFWSKAGYLVLDYTTNLSSTGGSFFGTRYNKADPAFIYPCTNMPERSRDIILSPSVADAGQPITITAIVRNFSNVSNNQPFKVKFYQGRPGSGGVQIGAKTIAAGQLQGHDYGSPLKVSIPWTASGQGVQKIYAEIDGENQLAEVHELGDPDVNNNLGYNELRLGTIGFIDMGRKTQEGYAGLDYQLSPSAGLTFYYPLENLGTNVRFDIQDAPFMPFRTLLKPFQLFVYTGQGSSDDAWNNPDTGFQLTPTKAPPAVQVFHYSDSDIAGLNEDTLNLYRWDTDPSGTSAWKLAVCPNYWVERFKAENLLVVPVCDMGTFAFYDQTPPRLSLTYLPVVVKKK